MKSVQIQNPTVVQTAFFPSQSSATQTSRELSGTSTASPPIPALHLPRSADPAAHLTVQNLLSLEIWRIKEQNVD